MKHLLLALVSVFSLAAHAGGSAEAAIAQFNQEREAAVQTMNQAVAEFKAATEVVQSLQSLPAELVVLKVKEARATYESARNHFREAQTHMQTMLNIQDSNPDLEATGREEIQKVLASARQGEQAAQQIMDKIDSLLAQQK